LAAVTTDKCTGIALPVEKQEDAGLAIDCLFDGSNEWLAQHGTSAMSAQVNDLYAGPLFERYGFTYNDALLLHSCSGLKRGMGRTQDQHSRFLLCPQPCYVPCMVARFLCLFKGGVFFSLDPNHSDRSQWKKNSRSGSYDHSNDLRMDLIPDIGFHLVRETAMETDRGDAYFIITNQTRNPLGSLCFANEEEDCLFTVEQQANGLLQ
jgi:hypothetical protein